MTPKWTPPKCKRCKVNVVARNGHCRGCDPHPVRVVKIHDPNMSPDVCGGWQHEERLPDGRPCTVVTRISNYGNVSL